MGCSSAIRALFCFGGPPTVPCSFSTQSEVWQRKIDAAGQQIAAILALVDGRNLTLEGRLGSMERWRDGAEDAWAKQSQVSSARGDAAHASHPGPDLALTGG